MVVSTLSLLRVFGSRLAPRGLDALRRLLVRPRRLPLGELDDTILADLGLSRGELRAALRAGREPRRGH